MTTFNINEKITVRLTTRGRGVLADYIAHQRTEMERYGLKAMDEFTVSDTITAQAWQIMSIFGPHMAMGLPMVFETDVELHNVQAEQPRPERVRLLRQDGTVYTMEICPTDELEQARNYACWALKEAELLPVDDSLLKILGVSTFDSATIEDQIITRAKQHIKDFGL